MKTTFLISAAFSLFIFSSCSKTLTTSKSSNNNLSTGDTTAISTSLKPQINGLMNRSFNNWILENPASNASALSLTPGIVVNVGWNALQNYEGAPINTSIIDTALGFVQQANKLNPGLNLRLKIRLFCGYDSPSWVLNSKDLGGPLLHKPGLDYAEVPQSDTLVPRWWQPVYINYFKDLENKLAAKYDGVSEIEEITTSACGTFSSETLVHQFAPQSTYDTTVNTDVFVYNIQHALAAGYTNDADIAAQKASIDAMHAWKYTRVSFVFNEYEYINPDNTVTTRDDIAENIMSYFVNSFGTQAVLGNNGLRDDGDPSFEPGGLMYELYDDMKNYHDSKGIPVTFQTAQISRVGNLYNAMINGVGFGAGSIELPEGYENILTTTQLQSFETALTANAVK